LDEHGIKDRDCSWSIIVLNFEFLPVLNHDDVIWDCPNREDLRKRKKILEHTVLGRMRGVVKTL
jgi:hypothetical protein